MRYQSPGFNIAEVWSRLFMLGLITLTAAFAGLGGCLVAPPRTDEGTRNIDSTARVMATSMGASAQTATAIALSMEQDKRAVATLVAEMTDATTEAAAATRQALDLWTSATRQALGLQAIATLRSCAASDRYDASVTEATPLPRPGTTYVVGNPPPTVQAVWKVTNTGQCAWEDVRLHPLRKKGLVPVMKEDRVQPGESVEVTLSFAPHDVEDIDNLRDISEEWVLVVRNPLGGEHVLLNRPHLRLAARGWIIAVTPTPIPMPTPIPTPTPTRGLPAPARTATAVAAGLYPAPRLVQPGGGQPVTSQCVTFQWAWDGKLKEGEFFDVRACLGESCEPENGVVNVTETSYRWNPDHGHGLYRWQVVVGRKEDNHFVLLSQPSAIWTFDWQGSPCGHRPDKSHPGETPNSGGIPIP